MRNKKIIIFILLCFITNLATPFTTPNAFAATSEIAYLEQFNKLTGNNYTDGDYLTREDFCVAISKIFIKSNNKSIDLPFVDIEQVSTENKYHLSVLYRQKILAGVKRNGKLYMRPDHIITRQEAVALLGKYLKQSSENKITFTDEDLVQSYAYGYVAWFAENGIDTGYPDGSFGPTDLMTARELAALTAKTMDYEQASKVNIETVFGTGSHGHIDGSKQQAMFTLPYNIICDNNGKITVFDTYSNAIRTIGSNKVETLTGGTKFLDDNGFPKGYYLDDNLAKALLNRPTDGVYNGAGELFFVDSANNVIRHIKGNTVYTFCGTMKGFKDGGRDVAKFNNPMAIAIDKNDNIYVADTLNNCIRKINTNGEVTTIAGMASKEGYKDGGALDALFRAPAGIAVNDDGSIIYVSDTGNHMIRKIEDGQVTTIAGTVTRTDGGYPLGGFKNGAADKAEFNLPRGIIIVDEVLIVADSGNNMIRAVTKSANVVTIAGNGEPGDFEGSCLKAVLNNPSGISYYKEQLYIADTGNNKIKKMTFDLGMYK